MTINEKIHFIRTKIGMSRAELAYKTDHTINEIRNIETNGTLINAYKLLKILSAFEMKTDDFQSVGH
jgi:transcriptional regulator with XRE-family HTH domain